MKEMSSRPQAVVSRRLAVAGLFELLRQGRSYQDIRISDICMQGGISRQTFYRNFDAKEDIISYYIHHLVITFTDQAEGIMTNDLQRFFLSMPFTPEFLKIMRDNNLMYLIRDSILPLISRFMETDMYHSVSDFPEFDAYYARYLADVVVSILETWASREFRDTNLQLYEIMLRFLSSDRD